MYETEINASWAWNGEFNGYCMDVRRVDTGRLVNILFSDSAEELEELATRIDSVMAEQGEWKH